MQITRLVSIRQKYCYENLCPIHYVSLLRDCCVMAATRYENQDANLCCGVSRKSIWYDFHTVMKSHVCEFMQCL